MAGNTFGNILRLSTFGESHGVAMGGVLDGVPSGVAINLEWVQQALDRRRPGQSALSTQRSESDQVEMLSGLHPDTDDAGCRITLGTPIGFIIRNQDHQSKDYEAIKELYRPGHADFGYDAKYGIRDHRGGGRSSARETATRVVGGAIAQQILGADLQIRAYVSQMAGIALPEDVTLDLDHIDAYITRCPHRETSDLMASAIDALRETGDSAGGVITCVVHGVPAGWGEPVFDKLQARLAYALMGINAVKGVEFGAGFAAADCKGSEMNDTWVAPGQTETNHHGGILGGISTGMPLVMRVAFKPVSSIAQPQSTIDRQGNPQEMSIEGRHDPVVVPRAVPIVEAMVALTLADFKLQQRIQTS